MERAADEYLTVVNETAVECEHNVDVLDYQQLLNCRIEHEIGQVETPLRTSPTA